MSTHPDAERTALSDAIRLEALSLGFDAVGLAPVTASEHAEFYRAWLASGRHGSMSYLSREDAVRARTDARNAWPAVQSAVVVALHYETEDRADASSCDVGIVARYARGRDYHKVMKSRLLALLARVENLVGREMPSARAYVDTGPVFERELARRAGLGWFGRNTMLIHPRRGSYFFLGTLLLDFELSYDEPFASDHCGSCSNCVSACPTTALLGRDAAGAPVMDATRCISYLTIENRGAIPRELRPFIGNRIFGCDICNEVCPWNGPKFTTLTREQDFASRLDAEVLQLTRLMAMDEDAFDMFSRGSPIRRAKRSGFLRNVAVALGNTRSPSAVPVLTNALRDLEPLVRMHAAWALGRIGGADATSALRDALILECHAETRAEMMEALGLQNVHA
jgi:epoxyqueuosine reductase